MDSFPPMENSLHWSQTPSSQQHMHDSFEFVVNLFHNRNIVEDSVITVKIIKSKQWIFDGIGLNEEEPCSSNLTTLDRWINI